jgi:hypothetical protein
MVGEVCKAKKCEFKATYSEGCQACLNWNDLEIVVGEGVEAGHWSRHQIDIPVNGSPLQRIPYSAAEINALSQPQHLWLTQIYSLLAPFCGTENMTKICLNFWVISYMVQHIPIHGPQCILNNADQTMKMGIVV